MVYMIGCFNVAGDCAPSGKFDFIKQTEAKGPDEVCPRQLWKLQLVSWTVIRWLLLSQSEKYFQASSQIVLYDFIG